MEDKTKTTMDGQSSANSTTKDEPYKSQIIQNISINTQQNKEDGGGDGDLKSPEQDMVKRKALEMSLMSSNSISYQCEKRGRGRPRGSGKLQLLASVGGLQAETAGRAFTPYVLTANAGEDVVKKLLSFSQNVARPVCILSANGTISSVMLCHPNSSGATLRYEGLFEILNLCGPYKFGDIWSVTQKSSLLRITLAKPNGGVFGGIVAGALIAAGYVQIVVGTFKKNIMTELKMRTMGESSASSGILGNPEINGVLHTDTPNDNENCATPTSSVSEPTNEEGGNTATAHHSASDDSQEVVGQDVVLSPEPICAVKSGSPQM